MIKEETLSVSAIKEGTVIDHIPAGQGLKLLKLLNLAKHHTKVTVGLNLPSRSMGYKDLIKVEEFTISPEIAGQIAIFAPHATLIFINNYAVVKKEKVQLPTHITKVVRCNNVRCITNHEPVETKFFVKRIGKRVELNCNYCQKSVPYEAD
jgi:aspartate carbamoyltransferase regulatory subunit